MLFEITDEELADFNAKYDEFLKPEESDEGEDTPNKKVPEKVELSKFLLIKKDYEGNFYIHISDEKCEEKTEDIQEFIGNKLFDEICERIPKFVYYSEYGNLDSDLYLPRVKEDLARIDSLGGKERMKARTLKILFGHLNLNPDEILALGQENKPNNDPKQKTTDAIEKESRNKQERFAKIESAATYLSSQFKDWCTQEDYTFRFNADGEYFRIFVSDGERPSQIELESRSKGLQWFFSFFLVFLAESKDNLQGVDLPNEGIVMISAAHEGCSQKSVEEGYIIKAKYHALLGQEFTDRDGTTRPITEDDMLVVTPYNVQVNYLRSILPENAKISTVDKFQGQEAPIVLISMVTSSSDDLPRNIEFLYSKNRLNVAVSRAQCLAVVVANTKLLEIPCGTVGQMKLVNTFCWLDECASVDTTENQLIEHIEDKNYG